MTYSWPISPLRVISYLVCMPLLSFWRQNVSMYINLTMLEKRNYSILLHLDSLHSKYYLSLAQLHTQTEKTTSKIVL